MTQMHEYPYWYGMALEEIEKLRHWCKPGSKLAPATSEGVQAALMELMRVRIEYDARINELRDAKKLAAKQTQRIKEMISVIAAQPDDADDEPDMSPPHTMTVAAGDLTGIDEPDDNPAPWQWELECTGNPAHGDIRHRTTATIDAQQLDEKHWATYGHRMRTRNLQADSVELPD